MKALVVYDSVFGNTEKIAQVMGQAIGSQAIRVGDVRPEHLTGLDVLLVGSPTRGFSPTPAVKNWLKGLAGNSLQGIKVAGFDTRMSLADVNSRILNAFVKVFGYAAEPVAKQLAKKGGAQALSPEGFFVNGSEGPLKEGELERAAAWAKQLATVA